jgi:hypothetical protein
MIKKIIIIILLIFSACCQDTIPEGRWQVKEKTKIGAMCQYVVWNMSYCYAWDNIEKAEFTADCNALGLSQFATNAQIEALR